MVFHHCFCRYFHFTIVFYFFYRVISLLIAFVHFITVSSSGFFISPLILLLLFWVFSFHQLSLPWLFFSGVSFLCCCTACATDLRELFLLLAVVYLHSFLTFGTTYFYQCFPGAGNSALKVAGPSTEVRNTDPAHLFVWITQGSVKDISR